MPDQTPAQIAYAAYGETTGGLNHQGLLMPAWDELPVGIRLAWAAAAGAVTVAVGAVHTELEQLRRTAGGRQAREHQLRHQLADAEARVAAVRALCTDAANPCRWHVHLCPADVRAALDVTAPDGRSTTA